MKFKFHIFFLTKLCMEGKIPQGVPLICFISYTHCGFWKPQSAPNLFLAKDLNGNNFKKMCHEMSYMRAKIQQ